MEPHQGEQDPLDPPLESKPQIQDPTCQNHVSGYPGRLLKGIETRMSGSKAHLKPPITRLHPDR